MLVLAVPLVVGCLLLPGAVGAIDSAQTGETRQAVDAFQQGEREQAIRSLMPLAYQGNVAAQFNLGVINHNEDGTAFGARESVYWFERAAEAGDPGAQFNLGMLLLREETVDRAESALKWLERSAQGGYRPAQVNLGILAMANTGFPLSVEAGRRWLERAAQGGDSLSGELLSRAATSNPDPAVAALLRPLDLELRSAESRGTNRVTQDGTKVYALPSGRQVPLLTLEAGDMVEVVGNRQGWANVRLKDGLPAWIAAAEVTVVGQWAEVLPLEAGLWETRGNVSEGYRIGTVGRGERMPVLGRDPPWVQVRAPVRFLGWVRQGSVDLRVQTVRSGVRADKGPVPRMRSLPVNPGPRAAADAVVFRGHSRAAPPLGRLLESTVVKVSDETEDRIPLAGSAAVYGWIHGSLVDHSGGVSSVQKDGARVRLDPDTDGNNIINLRRRGEALEVLDGSGDWLRIRLAPVAGWVNGEFVTR